MRHPTLFLSAVFAFLAAAGCDHKPADVGGRKPPEVTVGRPVTRTVVDYEGFTGRTDAVEEVEVRARTTGYLKSIDFQPGAMVKGPESPASVLTSALGVLADPAGQGPLLAAGALNPFCGEGQLLFEIDPGTSVAAAARARADLAGAGAQMDKAQEDFSRDRVLYGKGSLSAEDFSRTRARLLSADSALKSAEADLARAELDLAYSRVTAPITGKVGRPRITVGNVVQADVTVLTDVVSQDRIYVYFDVDENTYQRYTEAVRKGELKPHGDGPVEMRRDNDKGYPFHGNIDFAENKLNRTTGTLQLRALFPDRENQFKAGEFVKVRVPIGDAHPAVLVPEAALWFDQGQPYVYVVDAENKVHSRAVTLGAVEEGGYQVAKDGLTADETIIVEGLQRVRDDVVVRPMESGVGSQESGVSGAKGH